MSEMLMTDQAATTTEGSTASQGDASSQGNASQQQATEGQTQQNAASGDAQGKSDANANKGTEAPVNYEFKAPEGKEFDPDVLSVYTEVAKELNLSQEAAQKILDRMGPKVAERQAEQLEALRTDWANSSKADKEFGGEKLQENLALAKKAFDSFGTPELRQLLNESGLGNHPEVIRFMYRAGKSISGDRFVSGSQGGKPKAASNADLASSLYPSQQ